MMVPTRGDAAAAESTSVPIWSMLLSLVSVAVRRGPHAVKRLHASRPHVRGHNGLATRGFTRSILKPWVTSGRQISREGERGRRAFVEASRVR